MDESIKQHLQTLIDISNEAITLKGPDLRQKEEAIAIAKEVIKSQLLNQDLYIQGCAVRVVGPLENPDEADVKVYDEEYQVFFAPLFDPFADKC